MAKKPRAIEEAFLAINRVRTVIMETAVAGGAISGDKAVELSDSLKVAAETLNSTILRARRILEEGP